MIGEKESSPLLGRSVGGHLESSLEEVPGMEENGGKVALSHVAPINCTETDKTFMEQRDQKRIFSNIQIPSKLSLYEDWKKNVG